MVIIRFPDTDGKRRAFGYLLERFPWKTWVTGEMMVPKVALAHLAAEDIPCFVDEPATYDRIMKLDAAAVSERRSRRLRYDAPSRLRTAAAAVLTTANESQNFLSPKPCKGPSSASRH